MQRGHPQEHYHLAFGNPLNYETIDLIRLKF